jgi:hypothetical protein
MSAKPIYTSIIEKVFLSKFKPGMRKIEFDREEIIQSARALGSLLPKNVGTVVYNLRYRAVDRTHLLA